MGFMALRLGVCTKINQVTFGFLLNNLVYTVTMENPLPISIKKKALPVMQYSASLKIKKDGFGLVVGWDSFAMTGNPFSMLQRKDLGSDVRIILLKKYCKNPNERHRGLEAPDDNEGDTFLPSSPAY
jgi:hypothetical protein